MFRNILCFGDSITFGVGENPSRGWCQRLKEYFESNSEEYHSVYNLGVPGETSSGLLRRFAVELQGRMKYNSPENKDVIIIAIGTNDSRWELVDGNKQPRIAAEQFKENIESLLKVPKAFSVEIIVLGLTPVDEKLTQAIHNRTFSNERVEQFNQVIREVCTKEKITCIDFFSNFKSQDYKSLLADGLHPNSKGYELMTKQILEVLQEKII